MRKIYSLMLIAAGLLIGTQVWAQNVAKIGSKTYTDLQVAFDEATNGQTITLLKDYTVKKQLDFTSGQKVTLDLQNFELSGNNTDAAKIVIWIMKGDLTLAGTGKITNNLIKGGRAIRISGSRLPIIENNVPGVFSKLTVGENVSLSGESRAIEIYPNNLSDNTEGMNAKGIFNTTLDGKNTAGFSENVFVDVYGSLFGGEYGIQSSGNLQYPTKQNVSTILKRINSNDIEATDQDTINYLACVPHVHIYPSAECKGGHEYQDGSATHYGTGVYAGGYASFLIEGLCYGANGVYIKNSDVKFNNANVYSDFVGQEAKEVVATGSGIIAAGSGVVIESNKVYKGQTSVVVQGDTKIAGGAGNAIEQTITTGEKVQLEALKILGGTIESGDKGGIVVAAPNVEQVEVSAGSIEGQTIKVVQKDCTEDCETEVEISQFIPKDEEGNQTSHTILIYDETGETLLITVVILGPAPTKIEDCANFDIMTCADQSIDFANCEKEVSLTGDLTMKEIVMISNSVEQKITVPSGMTLIVDYLVMGVKANITVEPGGKLIVKGNLGVKNVNASNIVLKTQEGKVAQFLFHPDVTSNRNPYATVEFVSKSYRDVANSKIVWQRFGVPTIGQIESLICSSPSIQTAFYKGNYVTGDWDMIGILNNGLTEFSAFNEPFSCYNMLTNDATGKLTFTFTGNLVGNADHQFTLAKKAWNSIANSYTGSMDVSALLEAINGNVDKVVYLYTPNADKYTWEPILPVDVEDEPQTVAPMQAFILKNHGESVGIDFDYGDMVYAPIVSPVNNAPMRKQNVNIPTSMRILVKDVYGLTDKVRLFESSQFTDAFDNGFEAEKYMNEDMNLYVSADEKMSVYASKDVNYSYLGFSCVKGGEYTISFDRLNGDQYSLVDIINNQVIVMQEGVEYKFMAENNESDDYRFQIVRHSTPTNLQNAHVGANVMKTMQNGRLMIIKNGRCFNAMGATIKQ